MVTVSVAVVLAFTVKVAVWLTPPAIAVMTVERFVEPVKVAIEKFALVAPAGTVTDAGTVAAAVFELDRETATPPVGAAPEIVTVPVALVPPVTAVGLSVSAVAVGVPGGGG
jgi:hypothetical protein